MELGYDEFTALFTRFDREAVHLEMRDSYGTVVELPHMAQWARGEHDDLEWLQGWCNCLARAHGNRQAGRRARIVSEPPSDYPRWSCSIAWPMVEADEDIPWVGAGWCRRSRSPAATSTCSMTGCLALVFLVRAAPRCFLGGVGGGERRRLRRTGAGPSSSRRSLPRPPAPADRLGTQHHHLHRFEHF